MPEYPDITVYIERLRALVLKRSLEKIRLQSPFLLRTAEPPLSSFEGMPVEDFLRIGKRIVFVFPAEAFLVLHLMVSGRLKWRERGCAIPRKAGLIAFDFANGSLLITEAGSRKRASLHAVQGEADLKRFDRGGLEVLTSDLKTFRDKLLSENHTLKRALTDPRILSGIGNAYSDEILHAAGLSPLLLTQKLSDDQIGKLYDAVIRILNAWTAILREQAGDGFPDKVTAFREGMAVHGRFGRPCPVCDTPVQRIRYAANETNYCPICQTGGKLLADRSLSRILKSDWPRTLEELEDMKGRL